MIDSLRRFDLFSDLSDETLTEIARMVSEEVHPEGTTLFSEDSSAFKRVPPEHGSFFERAFHLCGVD